MTEERRKEIEGFIATHTGRSGETVAASMLRELLDELDLRNEQIRIAKQLLGELASGLTAIRNDFEGLQK